MIIQLDLKQYENVRDLFDGLWYHLNLFAVIEGTAPGQIFADDAENPTVALICEQVEGNWYLAGDCADPALVAPMMADPDRAAKMQEAGVTSPPTVYVADVAG